MGDEAIIDVADFTLEGRTMRPVRQAVTRVQRAGYHAEVVRHGDLSPETWRSTCELAERWRGAQTERGFSMALGRLGDPADARCVMVIARDADGVGPRAAVVRAVGCPGRVAGPDAARSGVRERADGVHGHVAGGRLPAISACTGSR